MMPRSDEVPAYRRGPRFAVSVLILGKLAGVALFFLWPIPGWILFHAFGLWFVVYGMVPGAQGLGPVITRFRTTRKEVWLTLDDGPDPDDTPRILESLARHRARATFFLIGERARRYPELVASILAAGHEVAHHTATHPVATFWCAGPRRVARELDDTRDALLSESVWFRPPAGVKTPFLHPALRRRGWRCVEWSIRSGDCFSRSVPKITAHVMRAVRPGAIILMHEGPSSPKEVRVVAIDAVLEALTRDGWSCVIPDPASAE